MKRFKYLALLSIVFTAVVISCKDESLDPYVVPEGAVHGYGQFVSPLDGTVSPDPTKNQFYSQAAVDAIAFFDANNLATSSVNLKFQWIGIDAKRSVESVDLYLEFDEVHTDADRNPITVNHGGLASEENPTIPNGKFWKTVTTSGNRQTIDVVVTPNDVYTLYQNDTYDYDADGTAEPIFSDNSTKFARDRSATRFYNTQTKNYGQGSVSLNADVFRVRWRLKTTDGLNFGTWGNSICTEFVGANCFGQWKVNADVFNPKATLTLKNNKPMKDAATEEVTIAFDRSIATAPTVSLSPAQGTIGSVTPVAGNDKQFKVTYTAPAGFTGTVSLTASGAVAGGAAPVGGLVSVSKSVTLTVDNQTAQQVSLATGTRIGFGGANTITLTFNEAMSAVAADALKISISGQGMDPITNATMILASNGLSASYLYFFKDSDNPMNATHGSLSISITGGKDLAGNAYPGSGSSLTNDLGEPPLPVVTLAGTYDLGTQLKWSATQGTGPSNSGGSTTGTINWVALASGSAAPAQATKVVQGVTVKNGFDLTGLSVKASGSLSVSAGSSGTIFTPFTANGAFDVYFYFVGSTGNISPNTATPLTITMN